MLGFGDNLCANWVLHSIIVARNCLFISHFVVFA